MKNDWAAFGFGKMVGNLKGYTCYMTPTLINIIVLQISEIYLEIFLEILNVIIRNNTLK